MRRVVAVTRFVEEGRYHDEDGNVILEMEQ
jgi:hypothetical protein